MLTDELVRRCIKREKRGSVRIKEVKEALDVRVVKRADKGLKQFFCTGRHDRLARCARFEKKE